MKKIASILLVALLIVSLCACGSEAAPEADEMIDAQPKVEATTAVQTATEPEETEAPKTATPTDAAALSAKELAESCIDKNVQELYDLIGEPNSSDYAPSCLVEGEDGMLYYDGFVVYTTREGDVETVYYVE